MAEPLTKAQCDAVNLKLSDLLERIGGKWTILIIQRLSRGPKRFSELKREIEGVSQKMLTATLRDLERDGFITRTVTPTIPPRVDYELTALGHDLRCPIAALATWAIENADRVNAARQVFSEREAA